MALSIFSNLSSNNSQRALTNNQARLAETLERVASGLRIRSASDDGGGLAITEGIRSDVLALRQGSRNTEDGVSLLRTAEGALNEISGILIRLRELTTQAATGEITQTQRDSLQLEFSSMLKEVDRIANVTEFNGQKLTDGGLARGAANEIVLQIGVDATLDSRFNINNEVDIAAVDSAGLGLASTSVSNVTNALTAMDDLSSALRELIRTRGRVGAAQNELIRATRNQTRTATDLTSAVSTIRDADMAHELAKLTRSQILVQTSSAMLGQSNLTPQNALTLLG